MVNGEQVRNRKKSIFFQVTKYNSKEMSVLIFIAN